MKLEHRGTYPDHWPQLSAAVKRAAGDRCIRCGHPSGDYLDCFVDGVRVEPIKELAACTAHCTHPKDGKLRALTVHHLDGDKGNDRWWNLLALCQVCHLQIQGKVIPERPWLFEHSEWFKPYVAGFYAWQHGVEYSRAEVEPLIDQLLLLGQPWLADLATPNPNETSNSLVDTATLPPQGDQ